HILHKIPDTVSYTEAALVEPAAVAMHAITISGVKPDDIVLVIGAGMVGMFVIQLLRIKGCKKIIAVDLDEGRLQLAKKVGAEHIFKPSDPELLKTIKAHSDGRVAELAIEVVGISETLTLAI